MFAGHRVRGRTGGGRLRRNLRRAHHEDPGRAAPCGSERGPRAGDCNGTHGAWNEGRLDGPAAAAIDRDANGREDAVAGVAAYAASDLLCYRAGAPADLAVRQEDAWQPLLDWAADRYGAHLVVTDGVVPVGQDAGALSRMGDAVSVLDAWQLAGVAAAAVATGSLVLALALFEGCVDAAQAWRASRIDADFQAAQWGADEEADAAAGEVRADIDAAARLLALLGD